MIVPYGTEASSSVVDQGQRQQEIKEVFPMEAEASYLALERSGKKLKTPPPPPPPLLEGITTMDCTVRQNKKKKINNFLLFKDVSIFLKCGHP